MPDPDRLISVATTGTFAAAGGFAFIASYTNIYDLCVTHGGGGISARLTPLSVDVLIMAASLVLLWASRNGVPVPWPVRGVLFAAVGASVAGNMLYGLPAGPVGAARSAWPGFAFVATIEILMWLVRASRARTDATSGNTVPSRGPTDAESLAEKVLRDTWLAGNPLSQNQLVTDFRLTRAEAKKLIARVIPQTPAGAASPSPLWQTAPAGPALNGKAAVG